MRIENARIRVVKCERVLTNYREEKNEERESETIVTASRNIESRVAASLWLQSWEANELSMPLKRTQVYNFFLGTFFTKNEIINYFYGMSWISYESKWLGFFFFRAFVGNFVHLLLFGLILFGLFLLLFG